MHVFTSLYVYYNSYLIFEVTVYVTTYYVQLFTTPLCNAPSGTVCTSGKIPGYAPAYDTLLSILKFGRYN